MEIRENRVHPDHTEHTGTENNDKNILPQRVFIVVLQNGNLLIALIYSWDTSRFGMDTFSFSLSYVRSFSKSSRTAHAQISLECPHAAICFFYQTAFVHKNLRLKRHLKKITSRVQIASHTVRTSFSSILKVNIAKFVFEQITFPSFSSFYLTFPSSSFIIFL